MKKFLCKILAVATFTTTFQFSAFANYEPPKEIWASFNKYAEAVENNDYENIIKYGLIDISILEKEPVNDTTTEWLCSRYQRLAKAYEHFGNFIESANMYEKQLPLAEKLGWYDSVKIAKASILNYRSDIRLFTKTEETQKYFGAINEPEMGVFFGIPADSEDNQKDTSMQLLYLEYGDTYFDWIKAVLRQANESGKAVEFAFNMPNQGEDISKIIKNQDYIHKVADLLAKYPKVKLFFRFGAEVDIWEKRADPEEYKEAFRITADIIHKKVKNAAMVFSPNMVSSWDLDFMDFYPGDEYVDWIGLSMYLMKYFQGIPNRPESERYLEVVFETGDNAEPVLMLKKFIDKFGDKKPIMISESGASHYIRSIGEDTTEWAKNKLSLLYTYLPMVYPQIKLIAHFDTVMKNEINDYALKSNNQIKNLYYNLVKDDVFVKASANNGAKVSYKELGDVIYTDGQPLEIYTYAHVYGQDAFKISYYLDEEWVASSDQMPYNRSIDFSHLISGEHTLKVVCENDNGVLYEESFKVIDNNPLMPANNEVKVKINGQLLQFEQPPVIIDGSTLVPMRKIFEALGASVDWEDSTKTAIANKGSDNVRIQIGNTKLIKNGVEVIMPVTSQLINDSTMVPVRAISEAFGAWVDWDNDTRTVIIEL